MMRRSALALISAATLIAVSPGSVAQEGAFGSGTGMHGTLESDVKSYTYNEGDRDIVVSMTVSLRYKMWRLMGEPVFQFVPRYKITRVQWGDRTIEPDLSAPEGTVRSPDGGANLVVSQDVFNKIRLKSFRFHSMLRRPPNMDREFPGVNRETTAVFEEPEKWGWDVPGSPSWKKTFTTHMEPVPKGEELPKSKWLSEAAAKKEWQRVMTLWKTRMTAPLSGFTIYRPKFSFYRFWGAVDRTAPGTSEPFHAQRRSGESDEEFAERSVLERQARALTRGLAQAATRARARGGQAIDDPEVARRTRLLQSVIQLGALARGAKASRELWSELREEAFDAELRKLVKRVEGWAESPERSGSAPEWLSKSLERLRPQVEEFGDALSDSARGRWEALRSLDPETDDYQAALARVKSLFTRYLGKQVIETENLAGTPLHHRYERTFQETSRGNFRMTFRSWRRNRSPQGPWQVMTEAEVSFTSNDYLDWYMGPRFSRPLVEVTSFRKWEERQDRVSVQVYGYQCSSTEAWRRMNREVQEAFEDLFAASGWKRR